MPPLIQVTVAAVPATSSLTVYRVLDGVETQLRAGQIALVPGGAKLLRDAEYPMGATVFYRAEVYDAANVRTLYDTATMVTPDAGRHILTDPFSGQSTPVDLLADFSQRSNAFQGSVLRPTVRRNPIVLADLRSSDAGTLPILTQGVYTAELEDMLASGYPLVSRHPNDACDTPAVEIFAFLDVNRSRRVDVGGSKDREWSLDFVVVDTPDPRQPITAVTYQDIATYYTGKTYANLAADHTSYLDIAQDSYGVA